MSRRGYGARGAAGTNGSNGADGAAGTNAYTTTTAQFTQPAASATVSVSVGNTAWMVVGQVLYLTTGGYYTVSSITNSTTVVLTNLGYTGNAAQSATVATGRTVSPGGIKGDTGAAGSNGSNGSNGAAGANGFLTPGTLANRPASATAGQMYKATDGRVYAWDGTLWRPLVGDVWGYDPGDMTGWTWVNQGSGTITYSKGVNRFYGNSAGASVHYRALSTALSGGALRVEMYIPGIESDTAPGGSVVPCFGALLRVSSGGNANKSANIMLARNNTGMITVDCGYWASATSSTSNSNFQFAAGWYAIDASTSNVLWQYSMNPDDASGWLTLRTVAKNTVFGSGQDPDHYGIVGQVYNANVFGQVLSLRQKA